MAQESITLRDNGDVKIVEVHQDLGSYVVSDLRETLDELVSQKPRKVAVNLSKVKLINSTAIGALVGAAKKLRTQDGDLKVCGLADNIKRAFNLVGASSVIETYESEDSLLASF